MAMEIKGTVIQIMPEQGGTSKAGKAWRKQDLVIETEGQYPKKVCLSMWGDKIDTFGFSEGDIINVAFEAESREHNGRWFTELKIWKSNGVQQGAPRQQAKPTNKPSALDEAVDSSLDLLPF